MLHEVLLALSGHPSPLFKDSTSAECTSTDVPFLSPSERALLRSIGQLSELHRKLRRQVEQITLKHPSTICRAVSTSIQQVHLSRFQDKIIDVESKILTKDASIVGAYDIVPLAGVVSEFDDWHRRIAWYWEMTCFMQGESLDSAACTGASLIDKLRSEQQTGFSDIQQAALQLSIVAEAAWLRQLASWVIYGKLPKLGGEDFFILARSGEDAGEPTFYKDRKLLPKLVNLNTASSILFIGKSLHQVRKYGRAGLGQHSSSTGSTVEQDLASSHQRLLSQVSLPIVPAQLTRSITAIRLSLSQNVLKHLLPMDTTLELLSCLKQFFLLDRGEFAVALIKEANSKLEARQQSMGRLLQQDPVKTLQGLSIKDAEFHQTLSATWKALASQDQDLEDDTLDFAQKHISLSKPSEPDSRPSTSDSIHGAAPDVSTIAFNDLLFPSATCLSLTITSPLDLFITPREVETYSTINTYLLAIRRSQLRLSDLWRRTGARRDRISSIKNLSKTENQASSTNTRDTKRRVALRKIWATCSAAIFLVSESSAYFEGEIIRESWDHFERWVRTPVQTDEAESSTINASNDSATAVQRDPETLAAGHRLFLAALTYALLLNDIHFTRELRSLLGNIDNMISFFNRLLDIQQKLDMENNAGGETGYTTSEEQRISLELDRARKKVDSDLKSVVNRLRQLDQERIGSGRYLNVGVDESGFEPCKPGGVDRLLMKLEFGRMTEEGFDIV